MIHFSNIPTKKIGMWCFFLGVIAFLLGIFLTFILPDYVSDSVVVSFAFFGFIAIPIGLLLWLGKELF